MQLLQKIFKFIGWQLSHYTSPVPRKWSPEAVRAMRIRNGCGRPKQLSVYTANSDKHWTWLWQTKHTNAMARKARCYK